MVKYDRVVIDKQETLLERLFVAFGWQSSNQMGLGTELSWLLSMSPVSFGEDSLCWRQVGTDSPVQTAGQLTQVWSFQKLFMHLAKYIREIYFKELTHRIMNPNSDLIGYQAPRKGCSATLMCKGHLLVEFLLA